MPGTLQFPPGRAILRVTDGWGRCPVCGRKMLKIRPDTVLRHFPAYCRYCRQETVVNTETPEPIEARAD